MGETGSTEVLTPEDRKKLWVGMGRRIHQLTRAEMIGDDLELSAIVWWLSENRALEPRLQLHGCRIAAFRLGGEPQEGEVSQIRAVMGDDLTDRVIAEFGDLEDYLKYFYGQADEYAGNTDWKSVFDDFILVSRSVIEYDLIRE